MSLLYLFPRISAKAGVSSVRNALKLFDVVGARMVKYCMVSILLRTGGILLVSAAMLIAGNCRGDGTSGNFRRIAFQRAAAEGISPLEFNKERFAWSDGEVKITHKLARRITRGTGIRVERRGVLRALPGLQGTGGIRVNVFARGEPGRLTVRLILRRNRATLFRRELKKIHREVFYENISWEGDFQQGDEVFLEVLGPGEMVASDLVAYNIIPPPERTCVFLIAADNLRRDTVGRIYKGVVVTPHIDAFAGDAVVFERAFAQSSWTLPSFMAMFTGRGSDRIGVSTDTYLSFSEPFLVESLSRRFICVNFNGGSWMQSSYGNSRGFDLMDYTGGAESMGGAGRMFRRTTEFLDNHRVPDLFMFCHTYHVHSPFTPDPVFLHKLNDQPRHRELRNYTRKNQFLSTVKPERKRFLTELYLAEAMEFDHHFGRFISHLKSLGLYRRSLIILLSDHGEAFGEHGGWFHGHTLYNELIRVPLIIKFPDNRYRGKQVRHLAALVDIFPTLLNYFDIPVPRRREGVDLMPAVTGDRPVRSRIWSALTPPMGPHLPVRLALIFGEWKLIRNLSYPASAARYYTPGSAPPPLPRYQLFNLKEDPGETRNVFGHHRREMEKFCREMERRLSEMMRVRRQAGKGEIFLDEGDREQLRSLGYLE